MIIIVQMYVAITTHHIQIEEVCQDANLAHDLGVPGKLTNYVAYIDLVLLRLASNTIQYNYSSALFRVKSDSSRRQWTVFQLEEYPARPDTPLLIDEEAYGLR